MNNRKLTILGNTQYLIEYISHEDMDFVVEKNFLMLRRYSIFNDIAVDYDIYFISTEDYKSYFNDKTNLVWPIKNDEYKTYSSNILNYANYSLIDSLKYDNNDDSLKDFYFLYDGNINEKVLANIPCDEIRIYSPSNRKKQDFIIDVTNLINDITFHYFCKLSNKQTCFSEKEIKMNNVIYSEYISFYIPSKTELFRKNAIYFVEDLNPAICHEIVKNEDNITELKVNNNIFERFPLNLVLEPYQISYDIVDGEKINKKVYNELSHNSQYNYNNIGINVVLYHYNEIDSSNNYVFNTGIEESSVSFVEDNSFSLSSKLEFDDDGILSLSSRFIYPKKKEMTLEEAYFYFNRIDDIQKYLDFTGWDDSEFLDEWDDDFLKLKDHKTGYIIEIATDNLFDNIIYRNQEATKSIQDFAFALNYIFDDWKQYPEVLFARTVFIDKYLSNKIWSNIVLINKEYFKYLINDIQIYRLNSIKRKQSKTMDYSNFNFIDKVNCIVNKKNNNDIGENLSISSNKNHIIYKPIFFKVHDLQNIKIRQNVVQNIGVNLGDFLTKVETFKLCIDDMEFVEYARNDIFVIFNINATNIINMAGKYDIVNQNNEYISSGNYELI